MSCGIKLNIDICIGKTFKLGFQKYNETQLDLDITGITNALPAVLTVTSHGLIDRWKVAVESVQGMEEINSPVVPSKYPSHYYDIKVIDSDHIELSKAGNEVNSIDFGVYTGGGKLRYYEPTDLSGCTVKMVVKDSTGATQATTEGNDATITADIDVANAEINIEITASDTGNLTEFTGSYYIDLVFPDGTVDELFYGAATVD